MPETGRRQEGLHAFMVAIGRSLISLSYSCTSSSSCPQSLTFTWCHTHALCPSMQGPVRVVTAADAAAERPSTFLHLHHACLSLRGPRLTSCVGCQGLIAALPCLLLCPGRLARVTLHRSCFLPLQATAGAKFIPALAWHSLSFSSATPFCQLCCSL